MACEEWSAKLDAYLDGELPPADAGTLRSHLRICPACAAETVERLELKRSVAAAGKRYTASPKFRAKIATSVATRPLRRTGWSWGIVAVPALLVLILSVARNVYVNRESAREQRIYSRLADLHVTALASATPVDVVSTDRHTVKPWFQGKIPFSFNLPELQGSDFTLLGGRITYLAQAPGAHLIYQVRKHEISVFIFQDRIAEAAGLPAGLAHALSFNIENWTRNGLQYFVVGDVSSDDIQALSRLLQEAR